ncbi:hypothetical protein ACRAWF_18475 [Streptomyces sp. L7]
MDALVERLYGLMGEAYADLAALPPVDAGGHPGVAGGGRGPLAGDGAHPSCRQRGGPDGTAQSGRRQDAVRRGARAVCRHAGRRLRAVAGVDPAEARQRALMAVLQTEVVLLRLDRRRVAVGNRGPAAPCWPTPSCHLLAPALGNDSTLGLNGPYDRGGWPSVS